VTASPGSFRYRRTRRTTLSQADASGMAPIDHTVQPARPRHVDVDGPGIAGWSPARRAVRLTVADSQYIRGPLLIVDGLATLAPPAQETGLDRAVGTHVHRQKCNVSEYMSIFPKLDLHLGEEIAMPEIAARL
jgi:hypothetical protein